jgi:hypothetical protein
METKATTVISSHAIKSRTRSRVLVNLKLPIDETVATNEIENLLMKENQDLRDENKILREKNTNVSTQ